MNKWLFRIIRILGYFSLAVAVIFVIYGSIFLENPLSDAYENGKYIITFSTLSLFQIGSFMAYQNEFKYCYIDFPLLGKVELSDDDDDE